jgi:hypothetical protein
MMQLCCVVLRGDIHPVTVVLLLHHDVSVVRVCGRHKAEYVVRWWNARLMKLCHSELQVQDEKYRRESTSLWDSHKRLENRAGRFLFEAWRNVWL